MPYEVELKFAAPIEGGEFELEPKLRALGAEAEPVERHVDRYFNSPARDFAATDEALRLRSVGAETILTYKGPKVDAATKTRFELEVPVEARHEQDLAEVLRRVGFREVRTVEKTRRPFGMRWRGRRMTVSIDAVAGLPPFIELETIAEDAEVDDARAALEALAEELGLANRERRSYLEMLLAGDQAAVAKSADDAATTTMYVGFGANLGDPLGMFKEAAAALAAVKGVARVRASSPYSSAAVGGPSDSAPFINGVFEVRTTLAPAALHAALCELEQRFGRERRERWGPRVVDLDLVLSSGGEHRAGPELEVPHPRMHYRRFVLEPLAELDPEAVHQPSGLTARTLAELARKPRRYRLSGGGESLRRRATELLAATGTVAGANDPEMGWNLHLEGEIGARPLSGPLVDCRGAGDEGVLAALHVFLDSLQPVHRLESA
jgi:2-amino-4-hydroxy-6-hydroxymethyldihydropteridine diphosphokinase